MTDKGLEEPGQYQFDDLTLDAGQRLVTRGDNALEVSGLTFDLLQAIVEAAPNVISADELAEKVWSGRPTSPETITQRAMMLRQALDDNAESPKYFEVVRGRGFRLIPDVNDAQYEAVNPKNRVGLVVAAIIVAAIAVAYLLPDEPEIPTSTALPNSVAILPFEVISSNSDDDYFAQGLHSEAINRLASIADIRVIAQRSVSRYSGSDQTIREIASELNVETVLEGTVRTAGEEFRLTLQLVDATTETNIWSDEYAGNLSDILVTQSDVARQIAAALEARLTSEEVSSLAATAKVHPEAIKRYLRAKVPSASREQQITHLNAAISIDPSFARAMADRAFLRSNEVTTLIVDGASDSDIASMSRLVYDDATKALGIDPNLGYAHVALGRLKLNQGLIDAARIEYQNALRLSPNDTAVLDRMGGFYSRTGGHEEAFRTIRLAISLDPNNGELFDALADAKFMSGDMQEAAKLYRRASELNYEAAGTLVNLGVAELALGNLSPGLHHLHRAEEQLAEQGRTIWPIVAYGFSAANQQDDAIRLARQLRDAISGGEPFHPMQLALISLAERDDQKAHEILHDFVENVAAHSYSPLSRSSWIVISNNLLRDPMLETAEFIALRQRMKEIYS